MKVSPPLKMIITNMRHIWSLRSNRVGEDPGGMQSRVYCLTSISRTISFRDVRKTALLSHSLPLSFCSTAN